MKNKFFNNYKLIILILPLLISCESTKNSHAILGETMGTTYQVKIISSTINHSLLKKDIDSILVLINDEMSTYIHNSTINKLNYSLESNIFLSDDFLKVLNESIYYHEISNGEFDVSINPLVELWGFSKDPINHSIPTVEKIDSVLQFVGLDKFQLLSDRKYKKPMHMKLDFSALAKGFAVDKISEYLIDKKYKNFSIEIGGEIRVKGKNKYNSKWNIGIQDPANSNISSYLNLSLTNKSVATSGNYRNYFISDGYRYSHIISPKSGYPINNEIMSVTVISNECLHADALATTLLLVGYKDGMKIIESIKGSEALFIYNNNSIKSSSGFNSYLN